MRVVRAVYVASKGAYIQRLTITCQKFSGLLTKKFINLIKHAEDGILDLNVAAETLEVIWLLVCHICIYIQNVG